MQENKRRFLMNNRRNFNTRMKQRERFGFPDVTRLNSCYVYTLELYGGGASHHFSLNGESQKIDNHDETGLNSWLADWLYKQCDTRIIGVLTLLPDFQDAMGYEFYFDHAEQPLLVTDDTGEFNLCILSVDRRHMELDKFKMPFGMIREVTDDPTYSLYALATSGVPQKTITST